MRQGEAGNLEGEIVKQGEAGNLEGEIVKQEEAGGAIRYPAGELVMELLVSPRKKGESRLVRTKRSFYQNRPQKSWVRKYVQLILDSSIRNGTKSYPVPVNGLCPLFHKTLPEKTLTKSQLDVVNMSKPM